MAEEDKEFTYESLQDRDTIVRYLGAVSDAFSKGKLQLSSNGEKLVLETPPLVKFDVRAKQKRSRTEIVFKISWKNHKQSPQLRVQPLVVEADAEG